MAEWALLQSLIHGARPEDRLVAVVMPLAVAVVALTAGLALLTFVKAYGIAFLARPRGPEAGRAHEAPASMRAAMVVSAAVVVGLGLLPGVMATAVVRAVRAAAASTSSGWTASASPAWARCSTRSR